MKVNADRDFDKTGKQFYVEVFKHFIEP